MTREEYEKLLQSDYWKGYSYSLIKERNFTCEDCGRSFPNMRHMLQVHHLVYRDANPWSYNPEELIVLCKECHQKRHGIYHEEEVVPEEETSDEKIDEQPYTNTYTEELSKRYAYDNSPRKKRNWFKYAVLAYVILYLLYLLMKDDSSEQMVKETTTPVETSISNDVEEKQKEIVVPTKSKKKTATKKQEIKKENSNAEMEKNIGLVVIDYLQLVQGSNRRGGSREQEISEISRSLKILAKEINVPVIALSQLSRAVEQRPDHRPMLSDLRESGAIEQDADIVMFLYRDDYYNKESEKKDIAEVIIAKQRGGSTGTVELLWMGNYTKFVNLERRFDD